MVDVDVTSVVFQPALPLILYSTWYLRLRCSPAIAVQVTIRAGPPEDTVLVRLGGLTLEGTVSEADTYGTFHKKLNDVGWSTGGQHPVGQWSVSGRSAVGQWSVTYIHSCGPVVYK